MTAAPVAFISYLFHVVKYICIYEYTIFLYIYYMQNNKYFEKLFNTQLTLAIINFTMDTTTMLPKVLT